MRIALRLSSGSFCRHFGQCETFAFYDVSAEARRALGRASAPAPPHAPGALPRYLQDQHVDVVLAGGMGSRAQALLERAGIRAVTGGPGAPAEELVQAYLNGTLTTVPNACDH